MTKQIDTDETYEIDEDGVQVTADIAVHNEVSDSEFDLVLVGSNPDTGSEMIAFGFHEDELPLSNLMEELQ